MNITEHFYISSGNVLLANVEVMNSVSDDTDNSPKILLIKTYLFTYFHKQNDKNTYL